MFLFECRCRCQCQWQDANVEISNWPFIDLSGTTLPAWVFYDFHCGSIKILAKFGTTGKMLNASLLWSCVELLFWVFKDCLRISVMFATVEICKVVFITSESTDYEFSADIWCEVVLMWSANYCFGMHAYIWWRIRGTINREKDFLKIEKISLIMEKNALLVFILGLNVHLCSHLKCCFESTYEENLRVFFHVL